jgi:hypothetical protein
MTFSEAMDALKKHFENDSTTASNLVRTVKQSPDEPSASLHVMTVVILFLDL